MGPFKLTDKAAEFELEVFAKKVIVVILILAGAAVIWIILPVLLLALVGALMAIMLQGLANLVHRYGGDDPSHRGRHCADQAALCSRYPGKARGDTKHLTAGVLPGHIGGAARGSRYRLDQSSRGRPGK